MVDKESISKFKVKLCFYSKTLVREFIRVIFHLVVKKLMLLNGWLKTYTDKFQDGVVRGGACCSCLWTGNVCA